MNAIKRVERLLGIVDVPMEILAHHVFDALDSGLFVIQGYKTPSRADKKKIPDVYRDDPMKMGYALTRSGGVRLKVTDEYDEPEGRLYILNLQKLNKGIQILKNKYPHHYKDIQDERGDHRTSCALVECALFGEVIYN